MISIKNYKQPFDAITDFEQAIAKFTGAPYCVSTDCCTHAIEMCFILDKVKSTKFTPYTYLSVPMTMHKLGVEYEYLNHDRCEWSGEYEFIDTRIWDSARILEPNMYKPGKLLCLSFGQTKPLTIGHGGAILLDDVEDYDKLRQMRYDGRDLNLLPWSTQKVFKQGYHYYMRPEDCVTGLNLLNSKIFTEQKETFYNYPDCRTITIIND